MALYLKCFVRVQRAQGSMRLVKMNERMTSKLSDVNLNTLSFGLRLYSPTSLSTKWKRCHHRQHRHQSPPGATTAEPALETAPPPVVTINAVVGGKGNGVPIWNKPANGSFIEENRAERRRLLLWKMTSFLENLENLGIGYAIAFVIGFPFLLVTVVLLSFLFCHRNRNPNTISPAATHVDFSSRDGQIVIPQIIFVAEEEEEEEEDHEGGENDGGNQVPGLDQASINSYPVFPYAKPKEGVGGDGACSICLCEYGEGEMLRMMPGCCHRFHSTCVDAWLRINGSCPMCRTSPLSTPASTPLSELVPLSHHVDGRSRR